MKPERASQTLLAITRSKAKMFEYSVPLESHINLDFPPSNLFPLTIGLLGDLAATTIVGFEEHAKDHQNIPQISFAAHFFDAYIQTRLNEGLNHYFFLLASSSYYLCDQPGSSSVLAAKISIDTFTADARGVETLLLWLLLGRYGELPAVPESVFKDDLGAIAILLRVFSETGDTGVIQEKCMSLRENAYAYGRPRELLLADVLYACIIRKIENSVWTLIPRFTNLPLDVWKDTFSKRTFVKELWPSQKILGECGTLQGESTVIQMPTSAGKTKSVEIIIRSSFFSGRSRLCVIVAPFRALCHEITESLRTAFFGENVTVNELTDMYQKDFDPLSLVGNRNQVLVLTPEKLVYVLRQAPEIGPEIGLLILDEGHQFDSGTRGVTYELLLSELRVVVPPSSQKILISAVISNVDAISSWLNGNEGKVVTGNLIPSTFRSVGFASWKNPQGRVEYVDTSDITKGEFYVPRVIEQVTLARKKGEKKDRYFPLREVGNSVASYLGLKLVKNGTVAIFCGRKSTALSICEGILEAYLRNCPLPPPSAESNSNELSKFSYLYSLHFGPESIECKTANLGVVCHHGSIPNGLRMATETGLRSGDLKFVVCTSTLAQGVNLPIKYLLFTSIYQGAEKIRHRDFKNLIGRAGCSGIQTEGTILFADTDVYDNRDRSSERWRWRSVQELLDPNRTDPCLSSLLKIFEPLRINRSDVRLELSVIDLLAEHFRDPTFVENFRAGIELKFAGQNYDDALLRQQLSEKLKIADTIEGFLIASLGNLEGDAKIIRTRELAEGTLAYHLAAEPERSLLHRLFDLISSRIDEKVDSNDTKMVYSRTLLGVGSLVEIEDWIAQHLEDLLMASEKQEDLFAVVFPLIQKFITHVDFRRLQPAGIDSLIATQWIKGASVFSIKEKIEHRGGYLQAKTKKMEITLHHLVDLCESGLAYDGMLIIGALAELVESNNFFEDTLVADNLRALQKRVKYGLKSEISTLVYELGISDRIIAQMIGEKFEGVLVTNRNIVIRLLKANRTSIEQGLSIFPRHFSNVFEQILK